MLPILTGKFGSLFSHRFAVSYLAPASVAGTAIAAAGAVEVGVGHVAAAWKELQATSSVTAGVIIGIVLAVAAYLLQSATPTVLQFWEGRYLPRWLARLMCRGQRRHAARLNAELTNPDLRVPHPQRYFGYPHDPHLIRPTRLGNALAAAGEHPVEAYGLDGVLWWPRLMAVLPGELKEQLEDAKAPLFGLVNLATVLTVTAVGMSVVLGLTAITRTPFWLPSLVGLPLAWLCYRGAVGHAVAVGMLIRVAFDLHRLDILRGMSIRVPENYETEQALWTQLNGWMARFAPPGATCPTAAEWMRAPFTYAAEDSDK